MGVHEGFELGQILPKDTILIKIDPADFEKNLVIAQAQVSQQKLLLEEEKARSIRAKKDFERLGKHTTASELSLRKPYLVAAQANYQSALANLEKAQLALDRTNIKLPYRARIREKKYRTWRIC